MKHVDWRELAQRAIWFPEGDVFLSRFDIAFINMICAYGLPGAEKLDIGFCIEKLNEFAKIVQWQTSKEMRRFERDPAAFKNSRNFFRAVAMITVLQRDLGVRYNPAKIPADAPFDAADTSIHGILQGEGGTCATLPVLYAAVGRRLGYPIKLIATQAKMVGHLLCRWDDGIERFNIEATAPGLAAPTDEEFRKELEELSPDLVQGGQFLVSQTPKQEMAGFLAERGLRWKESGNLYKAAEACIFAAALAPQNLKHRNLLHIVLNEWTTAHEARKPKNFPQTKVFSNNRQFPGLANELEGDFFALEAIEFALNSGELNRRWWGPMKAGNEPGRFPKIMNVYPEICKMEFEIPAAFEMSSSFVVSGW